MNSSDQNETIYTPRLLPERRLGFWQRAFRDSWRSRSLILRLARKDISVRYRQSFLGYVWAVLPPIATMMVFVMLARYRVLPIGGLDTPYPVFVLWNLGVWYLFTGILTACTNSLTLAGPLVTKLQFNKDALVIAAAGYPIFEFFVRLIPVVAIFAWYGVVPAWGSVLVPFVVLGVVALGLGFGFILAVVNLLVRDIGSLVSLVLMLGMFLAPILYPLPDSGLLHWVNVMNPFSPMLVATQDLIFRGDLAAPMALGWGLVMSFGFLVVGWALFQIVLPRVVEQA